MNDKKLEDADNSESKSNALDFQFDFGQLIAKHPIRWEIWGILQFYNELNINQISQFLKQSRYTVSRHLKLMERDGMLISREVQPEKRGKYAPKYYRVNPRMSAPSLADIDNIDQYMDAFIKPWKPPKDPKSRLKFYRDVVREHKMGIVNYGKSIEGMHLLFDELKKNISRINYPNNESLKSADILFQKYLAGIKEPFFVGLTFDKNHFIKFREIYKEFWQKLFLLNIDQLKNPDPEGNYFSLMTIVFPSKALIELKKELYSEN